MALFVGRLESSLLGVPLVVVVCLYGYSAIQFAQVFFFEEHQFDIKLIMTSMALFLKFLLFVVVHWVSRTGRLFFYMVHVRAVRDAAQASRRDFLGALSRDPSRSTSEPSGASSDLAQLDV